ncbi:SYT10 protein, partial [Polypterus senegalus]
MEELIKLFKTPKPVLNSGRAERPSSGFPRDHILLKKSLTHTSEPVSEFPGHRAYNLPKSEAECRWMGGDGLCALANPLTCSNTGFVVINGYKLLALFDSGSNISIVDFRYVLPRQRIKKKTSIKCIHGDLRMYDTALCFMSQGGTLKKHPMAIHPKPPFSAILGRDWSENKCGKLLTTPDKNLGLVVDGDSSSQAVSMPCTQPAERDTEAHEEDGEIPDISVSLLAVVVSFCGLALLVVSLFVFWKLCWPCWRSKALTSHANNIPQNTPTAPPEVVEKDEKKEILENGKSSVKLREAAMKISQTSPDIPAEVQTALKEHLLKHSKIQRQITEPTSSSRHNSFRRHLPRQMHVSSVDLNIEGLQRRETTTSIGRIKPELYKQKSIDSDDSKKEDIQTCGKLNFTLQYDYENEMLVVRIVKALELPAKDITGTSDPYVKIYLLPDRKKKFQTRVHRKTLDPIFDETFQFPVAYDQLTSRKLHFSVYDFDRFTSHDMIGEVIVDNLFEISDLSRETTVWKDIHCATTESVDLGEIMYSLCYLPTAGRMTLTVIKCRNLKAMDITGSSDPYVKVSLMCDGRRLKKRKTTTKKNTLNPVYNEAIIFDIPPENVEQVSLSIMVMDYDRIIISCTIISPYLEPLPVIQYIRHNVPPDIKSEPDMAVQYVTKRMEKEGAISGHGNHSGCVLAPTLLNAYMDWVLGKVFGSSSCGASVGKERFNDLDFANNVVIFLESIEALIGALERLSEESECLDLQVSWTKTKTQASNDLLSTAH